MNAAPVLFDGDTLSFVEIESIDDLLAPVSLLAIGRFSAGSM